jgi:hypothetical protein
MNQRKIILALLCLLAVPLKLYSQEKFKDQQIQVSFLKAAIDKWMQYLNEKYAINFSYVTDEIKLDRIISLKEKKLTLETLLDKLFKDENIRITITDKQVILKKESKVTYTISGRITDTDGENLEGAGISVSSSGTIAISNR